MIRKVLLKTVIWTIVFTIIAYLIFSGIFPNWLLSRINVMVLEIRSKVQPVYVQAISLYVALTFIWWFSLVIFQLFLKYTSDVLYDFFHCIRKKSIKFIRFYSEVYYILDKFLYKISPRNIGKGYTGGNRSFIEETEKYSVLFLYDLLSNFLLGLFSINLTSITFGCIVLFYVKPGIKIQVDRFISNLNFDNIKSFFSHINFQAISGFWSVTSIIVLVVVVLLFQLSTLKSKVIRKIVEEKYEKLYKYQEKINAHLAKIIYCLDINIDSFSKNIHNFPNVYCRFITGTKKYSVVNGKLHRKEKNEYYNDEDFDFYLAMYEDLSNEIDEIEKLFKEIRESNLSMLYFRMNKFLSYEENKVNDYRWILGKEYLEKYIMGFYNRDILLKENFTKLREVWEKSKSKEDINEDLGNGILYTYDEILSNSEESLQKRVCQLNNELYEIFADSILYYVVINRYLIKINKLNRFDFFKYFLTLFGK